MRFVHAISPLGGWLVSALPIPNGGEGHNFSTGFSPNTNSSILIQCKNKLRVNVRPTPTKENPKPNIECTTVCALQNTIISNVCELRIQQRFRPRVFKKRRYKHDSQTKTLDSLSRSDLALTATRKLHITEIAISVTSAKPLFHERCLCRVPNRETFQPPRSRSVIKVCTVPHQNSNPDLRHKT